MTAPAKGKASLVAVEALLGQERDLFKELLRESLQEVAGLAAPVSDSGSGCDAGRRRARSVLTTYPRHGVMRGNHRLTFAR